MKVGFAEWNLVANPVIARLLEKYNAPLTNRQVEKVCVQAHYILDDLYSRQNRKESDPVRAEEKEE